MVRTLLISSIFALSTIVSAVPAVLGGEGGSLFNVAADDYIGTGPIDVQDSFTNIISASDIDLHDNANDFSLMGSGGSGRGSGIGGGGIGGIGGGGSDLDSDDLEYPYSGDDLYPDADDLNGGDYGNDDYNGGDYGNDDHSGGDIDNGDYDYDYDNDNDNNDRNDGNEGGCGMGRGRGGRRGRGSRRGGRRHPRRPTHRVSRPPRVRGGCR